MAGPPASHKEWVRYFADVVPGELRVTKYYDEDESHLIPIATSSQHDGLVAATVGLMDVDQSQNPDVTIPAEVVMDARGDAEELENVLSTIAFYIIKDGWRIRPGAVFEQLVEMYCPDLAVPHIYFTAPFQWGERMTRVELSDRVVYPLLAVPISEPELKLLKQEGDEALEAVWESAGTDVLSWTRGSAV